MFAEVGESDVEARARLINEEALAEVALLRQCFATELPLSIRRRDVAMPMMMLQRSVAFAADAFEEITVTGSRIEREEFGDYQLYRLPWRTDLAARQTKQVLFLDEPEVEVERFYGFRLESLTEPACRGRRDSESRSCASRTPRQKGSASRCRAASCECSSSMAGATCSPARRKLATGPSACLSSSRSAARRT